jgi:hypothetical protein
MISGLCVLFPRGSPKADDFDPAISLLLFVDDLPAPRASVRLVDRPAHHPDNAGGCPALAAQLDTGRDLWPGRWAVACLLVRPHRLQGRWQRRSAIKRRFCAGRRVP